MSTSAKRTTIYLPRALETELDDLKRQKFYKDSFSNMIGHLIRLGIKADAAKNPDARAGQKGA